MNRNQTILSLFFTVCLLLTSCDDGDIHLRNAGGAKGGTVIMRVSFSDLQAWPSAYQIVLAAYGKDMENPLMSKQIPEPKSEEQMVELDLNGLPEETEMVAVSLLTKGRKRICNFYAYQLDRVDTDIVLPVERISLAAFSRIQQQIFNSYCTACHGVGERAAAGLFLTEGKSHAALVDIPANLSGTGKMRVKPEEWRQSFLIEVLTEDILKYNHTDVLPQDELLTVLKTWISNGADDK